jgi:hypothetical protein
MPAKFRDYPVYVYDDPAIYNNFTGGLNTHPSNDHLLDNELRDCLNMHYSSAGLVKREGAKQLCTITCDVELFNIQAVFIFTYKIPYLIIAADGKLYKGLFNENISIKLTRLFIYFKQDNTLLANSPIDMSLGLDLYYEELTNQLHSGFIHRSFQTSSGLSLNPLNYKLYNVLKDVSEGQTLLKNNIVYVDNKYYLLTHNYTKVVIKPDESNSAYWVKATPKNLSKYKNYVFEYYKNNPGATTIQPLQVGETLTYVISNSVNTWTEQITNFSAGEIVQYNGEKWLCILTHHCLKYPIDNTNSSLTPLVYKDSLIFQNKESIQFVTYNNIAYIATGTRLVEVYFTNNELIGYVCTPYMCSYNEVKNLGGNLLSPYPEYCLQTLYDQVDTNLNALVPLKNKYGIYTLTPIGTFEGTLSEKDFCYKWEKYINNQWVTLISFKDNYLKNYRIKDTFLTETLPISSAWSATETYEAGEFVYIQDPNNNKTHLYRCVYTHNLSTLVEDYSEFLEVYYPNGVADAETYITLWELVTEDTTLGNKGEEVFEEYWAKQDYSTLKVTDADKYQYRVSIANEFAVPETGDYMLWKEWKAYKEGDIVYAAYDNSFVLFECVTPHNMSVIKPGVHTIQTSIIDENGKTITLWARLEEYSANSYYILNNKKIRLEDTTKMDDFGNFYLAMDFVVAELTSKFSQVVSTLDSTIKVSNMFETIQSCNKVLLDGNKLLYYHDAYNSGSWFKTKIDNPYYITELGCLSFKTTKNEALIHVVNFSSNIIAFAYSEGLGGSIHLVSGNGDDYSSDEYYSPYKKSIISDTICCDNANTVQVCENFLFFKSFSTIYYIVSSELSNDVITLYSANDKIKLSSPYVTIPWDDNSCISEVTEDYYALIWNEKYTLTNVGLTLVHPGLRIKLYYKLYNTVNNKIYFPWLRDESKYFNIQHILYIKGQPIYLYNNLLLSFNNTNCYTDLDDMYECLIHLKGVDTNYPKLLKLLNSIILYYYNNQNEEFNMQVKAMNEAGFPLLDSSKYKKSLQDLRTLKVGSKLIDNQVKLDTISLASKTFNADYRFPYLTIETIIKATSKTMFALSSITYTYTTTDTPDSTIYDTYTKIIRKKEI